MLERPANDQLTARREEDAARRFLNDNDGLLCNAEQTLDPVGQGKVVDLNAPDDGSLRIIIRNSH